jgi:uncharacterized protein
MKCPIDGSDLVMAERQGIEIDYCPKCRGIWLDRGELDKIVERSEAPSPPPSFAQPRSELARRSRYDQSDDDRSRQDTPHHKKRKSSFLGELFDFD